ncbi:hypothetical protein BB559_000982 [Furculomyces boomerangus]|uniref:Uncharacterized protein n=1 Tax=Furculomyces boomerangus TaxID=61424 RepID=A0A2T9Z3H2_9FUNG|nr:hypothetical protein BB559_000982 [Furculomyces boomerangus]
MFISIDLFIYNQVNKCATLKEEAEQNSCVKKCYSDNGILNVYEALTACHDSCTESSLECKYKCTAKIDVDIMSGKISLSGNSSNTTSSGTSTPSSASTSSKIPAAPGLSSFFKSKQLLPTVSLFAIIFIIF